MRRQLWHIASLAAVAAALLVGATSASAVTVTVSPGGTTAGTGTGASQIVFATGRRTISCTTPGFAARYVAGTFIGVPLPFTFTDTTDAQLTFSTCSITGGLTVAVTCTRATRFNATGLTTAGVTPISFTGISCTAAVSAAPTCRVNLAGGVLGSHTNATGQIATTASGSTLAASGSTCVTLPNDTTVQLIATYRESPAQTIGVS